MMRDFSSKEIEKANKLHQVIKTFGEYFPEEFKKCDIKLCDDCEGKGFLASQTYGTYFAGLGGVCQKCNGVGFIGFKFLMHERVCKCNGVGCEICNQRGTVDWIDAIIKGCK